MQHFGILFEKHVLAGDGLTDWTQSSNPNTDEGQYIHEKNKHTQMMGYGPQVSYSGVAYPSDPFNYWLYKVGKNEFVGAKFEEIEVETWNPSDTTNKVYNAYKRVYEVQPDNPGSGEGGGRLAIEGTFSQFGSVVLGTFNIETRTFTENMTEETSA